MTRIVLCHEHLRVQSLSQCLSLKVSVALDMCVDSSDCVVVNLCGILIVQWPCYFQARKEAQRLTLGGPDHSVGRVSSTQREGVKKFSLSLKTSFPPFEAQGKSFVPGMSPQFCPDVLDLWWCSRR